MARALGRFKMDGGWKRWAKALDPKRFEKALRRHMPLATKRIGLLAVGTVRREVRRGGFARNAELTIHIKGTGKKPLVDSSRRLFQGLTSQVQDASTVFVGFLLGGPNFDAAAAIHEGATIRVSQKMRNMFRLLWMASVGNMDPSRLTGRAAELWARAPGGWLPLKPSTTVIRIPRRPFIERAFKRKSLKKAAKRQWNLAAKKALEEVARG